MSTETPLHDVSSFDHLVTQWMSTVIDSAGSAVNSSHVQAEGRSTAPSIANVQPSRGVAGVGPAESTGKSLVKYCPGGIRDGSEPLRRRPVKPRLIGDISRPSIRLAAEAAGLLHNYGSTRP